MRRIGIALIAGLLGLSACGGTDDPSSTEEGGAGNVASLRRSDTVYRQLAAVTGPDGSFTAERALQLFALQYGPLPGVTVPTGDPGPPQSGDLAIAAVFANWSELTEDQLVAIRERLEVGPTFEPGAPSEAAPSAESVDSPSPTGGPGRSARPGRADLAPYRRAVDQARAVLERHLGPLGATVDVVEGGRAYRVEGALVAADALLESPTRCRIRVFPSVLTPPQGANFELAHEVMHCFQYRWTGDVMRPGTAWVLEGGANWAASQVMAEVGGDLESMRNFLREYYLSPQVTLLRRTYTGVGFFATVAEGSGALWDRMRATTEARSGRTAYEALTAGRASDPRLANTWATAQTARGDFGADWSLDGPGVPTMSDQRPLPFPALRAGSSVGVDAARYATASRSASLTAPVTRFTVADGTVGTAHLGSGERPLADLVDTAWCTDPDGRCTCPPGTRRAGEQLRRLDGANSFVAVSGGGGAAAHLTITGRTLEDECDPEVTCPVGTWEQRDPPRISGATVLSGGTGTVLRIDEDGRLVQDFSAYVPLLAESVLTQNTVLTGDNISRTSISPTGSIRGRIDIPTSGAFTSSPVREVDASALGGTAWIELLGARTDVSVGELMGVATGIASNPTFGPGGAGPEVVCESDASLVLTAGGQRQTYRLDER